MVNTTRLWGVMRPRLPRACGKGVGAFLAKCYIVPPQTLGCRYCGVCGNRIIFTRLWNPGAKSRGSATSLSKRHPLALGTPLLVTSASGLVRVVCQIT